MATTTLSYQHVETGVMRRRIAMGITFSIIALLIVLLFAIPLSPQLKTEFAMAPGGITRGLVPNWFAPAKTVTIICAVLASILAVLQLGIGFRKWTNFVLLVEVLLFLFAFLTFSAAGKMLNIGGMLSNALLFSVPIVLGSFSGLLCERSGVVNIAIEGMMLMGAMVGVLIGSITKNMWIGLVCAMASGVLMGGILAVLSIKYKVNQIIAGTVINIFATGLTSYISSKFLQVYQHLNSAPIFPRIPIPLLADIPLIGPIFFNQNLFVYGMYLLFIILQIALFQTRWGLRLRSVGEHPKAADTLGINVFKTRYMAVLLGGLVAGFAGGYFTLGSVGRFDEMMTAGKGFIGLAALNFGNWIPGGCFGAGLIFGFFDTFGTILAILGSAVPPQFMAMLPYLATMIILAGVVGKGRMPAADGTPYEKE